MQQRERRTESFFFRVCAGFWHRPSLNYSFFLDIVSWLYCPFYYRPPGHKFLFTTAAPQERPQVRSKERGCHSREICHVVPVMR